MEQRIEQLLSKMTLEEKASLCSGQDFWHTQSIERLGIPSIMVADGPHGLRKQADQTDNLGLNKSVASTCFPTPCTLASSWDRSLLHKIGSAIADECLQEQISVILGPGINIKRNPLCGRNFEYYSEDPYISGELASGFIDGVQSRGVGTSLKHYAANNQESHRMTIDTLVDERTLREIYLAGFETAVKKSQPITVMCCYNRVNGIFGSEHPYLLTDILKNEWQHSGIVVTDWGAINDRVASLKAGLELEMPGYSNENDKKIVKAVRDGSLDQKVLDNATARLLRVILSLADNVKEDFNYNKQKHHDLAREAAGDSIVLLKNEDNILPIKNEITIALIGQFAEKPRYQGAGSSLINPTMLENMLESSSEFINKDRIIYAQGYDHRSDYPDNKLIQQACDAAKKADIAIVIAGLPERYETEGLDRKHMRMPENHNRLIEAVSDANPNTIVALYNGSPVEMPWNGKVKAILEAYLGGQAGAPALWDVIFGRVNPSGKLAESFPISYEDCPSSPYFPMGPHAVEYRESIYVGYRFYESAGVNVLYPFGHGLSYTTFEYSELELSAQEIDDTQTLRVTLKVKNTGNVFGKEIIQLYISENQPVVFRPIKELKGFEKVALEPGEIKEIEFVLDKRSFAYYSTGLKDWQVKSGYFSIMVGSCSDKIPLSKDVYVKSTSEYEEIFIKEGLDCYYKPSAKPNFPRDSFEILYGKKIVEPEISKKITMTTPVYNIRSNFLGRIIYKYIMKQVDEISNIVEPEQIAMMRAIVEEMPLRNLPMSSGGILNQQKTQALIDMMNGHIIKGITGFYSK